MMIQPSNLNNYLAHILVGNQYLPFGLLVHDFLGLIIRRWTCWWFFFKITFFIVSFLLNLGGGGVNNF